MQKMLSILAAVALPVAAYGQQQPTAPAAPQQPTAPGSLPQQQDPTGRAFDPANPPPGQPFMNTNRPPAPPFGVGLTNRPGVQGQFGAATNTFGTTNNQALDFSITNTLSRMAPAQAQNVIRVQTTLNAMQTLAASLRGVDNVQQIIQQNPRMQQQVRGVATQINGLALGSTRPSNDLVIRLSEDMLRAFSIGNFTPDHMLVLSMVINQTVNSGTLTSEQVDPTLNTGLMVLRNAGVPMALAHPITCDLHSIVYELQPALAR